MWPPWVRTSSGRLQHTNSSNFSCSSFKDIQTLCNEEPESEQHQQQQQKTHQPKKTTTPSIFHRVRISTSVLRNWAAINSTNKDSPKPESPPPESPIPGSPSSIALAVSGAEKRIVVYSTSLRAVRKTFEDCGIVRSILRGFRVHVDERDLLMDAGFLEELQGILGEQEELSLPRVFIGGRYVGGAEEIIALHETGELKKFVAGLQAAEPGVCDGCGGYRFVLCDQCDGSRKCFVEKGGFRSCTNCNENGLTKCPTCLLVPATMNEAGEVIKN